MPLGVAVVVQNVFFGRSTYAVSYEFEYLPDSETIFDCRKMTSNL